MCPLVMSPGPLYDTCGSFAKCIRPPIGFWILKSLRDYAVLSVAMRFNSGASLLLTGTEKPITPFSVR